LLIAHASCAERKHVGEKEVVAAPVDIDAAAAEIIETTLDDLQTALAQTWLDTF
jgi:hypothetical protein